MTYKIDKPPPHPAIQTPLSDPMSDPSPVSRPKNQLSIIPERRLAEAAEELPRHAQEALIEPFRAGNPSAMLEKAVREGNYLAVKFLLSSGGVDVRDVEFYDWLGGRGKAGSSKSSSCWLNTAWKSPVYSKRHASKAI